MTSSFPNQDGDTVVAEMRSGWYTGSQDCDLKMVIGVQELRALKKSVDDLLTEQIEMRDLIIDCLEADVQHEKTMERLKTLVNRYRELKTTVLDQTTEIDSLKETIAQLKLRVSNLESRSAREQQRINNMMVRTHTTFPFSFYAATDWTARQNALDTTAEKNCSGVAAITSAISSLWSQEPQK